MNIISVSEAKKRANNAWVKRNYKRVSLTMRFKDYDRMKEYCKRHNLSDNGFVLEAILEKLEREEKTDVQNNQDREE